MKNNLKELEQRIKDLEARLAMAESRIASLETLKISIAPFPRPQYEVTQNPSVVCAFCGSPFSLDHHCSVPSVIVN